MCEQLTPKSTIVFRERKTCAPPPKKSIRLQNLKALTAITPIKEKKISLPNCHIFEIIAKECFRSSAQSDYII